jgi:hypothetical protein
MLKLMKKQNFARGSILAALGLFLSMNSAYAKPSYIGWVATSVKDGSFQGASSITNPSKPEMTGDVEHVVDGRLLEGGTAADGPNSFGISEKGPNFFRLDMKSDGKNLTVSARNTDQKFLVTGANNKVVLELSGVSFVFQYVPASVSE